jgi:hypothetical protein
MEDTIAAQLEEVKQLIMLFQSFRPARMIQLQLLVRRPDSVCDILVYHRQVPLMTNDFTDTTIFQHQGIVSVLYRQFPEPHFFIMGFPEAVHNALESYYLAQVLQRLRATVTRHAALAARSPRPYPAYYEDIRNRRFVSMTSVLPIPRPQVTVPVVPFQAVQRPPMTRRPAEAANIAVLQQTLEEVQKIIAIQKQRGTPQTVRPIPVRAPAPSTVGPTPHSSTPPSRLQQHYSSTPEPEAYLAQNPFCTECNKFHSPLNINDFGPNDDQILETARQQSMEELRVQSDKFASDLLQSANEPPVRRRRVAAAARRASSPLSSPPPSSGLVRSPSFHRSLEPSPEPRFQPIQNETPGSSLEITSPASPTPSFTNRMGNLTVQVTETGRMVYSGREPQQ